MNLLALDLSLSTIGVADNYGGPPVCYSLEVPKKVRGVPRLRWIRERVLEQACSGHRADVVLIEGYSYGSPNRAHHVGELGGVIRVALSDEGVSWREVPPAVVKKLATGKGNAKKDVVLAEAIRRLGYEGSSGDESDALWLLHVGLIHYGLPGAAALPKTHLEALKKLSWLEAAA